MPKLQSKTQTLCRMGILAALYVLLTLVSIRAGNLKITFASLPVTLCALLFGPLQAGIVAFIGEFLNQLLSYGFTATTLLWLIPPALRGILIGLAATKLKNSRPLEQHPVLLYIVCLSSALITTLCNTFIIWIDSLLFNYYSFAYVFGSFLLRIFTGLITAAIIATVSIPLARLLRRNTFY